MEMEPSYNPNQRPFAFRILPFLVVGLFVLTAAAFFFYKQSTSKKEVFCTAEAQLCPDGSYVGRTGPNCEFAACPATSPQVSTVPSVLPTDLPTVEPTPTSSFSANCCTKTQLKEGYECVPNCGPPVQHLDDPPPGYRCLNPEQAKNRKYYGCPICLSSSTTISTPDGEVNIKEIKTGDMVWTKDAHGKKVEAPVLLTYSAKVPPDHKVIHLVLLDKRDVYISPLHPLSNKKTIDKIKVGNYYDGSRVVKTDLVQYNDTSTYDILPAGDTGFYWANGILVGSTLKK
jgi:hypothetical protein